MNGRLLAAIDEASPLLVPVGEDRFGKFKTLGISPVAVEVSRQESSGLFVCEITLQRKGGPAKYLH